jgi:hypothetical protein
LRYACILHDHHVLAHDSEETQGMLRSKTMPKLGIALGIAIMGGSVLGGIALTIATSIAPPSQPGSTVPFSDQAETNVATSAPTAVDSTSGATRPAGSPNQPQATPPTATPAAGSPNQPRATPPTATPHPTPTCWDQALGEHPPGIEDCQDVPGRN